MAFFWIKNMYTISAQDETTIEIDEYMDLVITQVDSNGETKQIVITHSCIENFIFLLNEAIK